jgi:hypothetical protein
VDLGTVVPYVGATGNVNLGSYNLITAGTVSGEQLTSTHDISGSNDVYIGADVVLGAAQERLVYPTLTAGVIAGATGYVSVQFVDYGGTPVTKNIAFDCWLATSSMGAANPTSTVTISGGVGTIVTSHVANQVFLALTNSSGRITFKVADNDGLVLYFHVVNPSDGKVYNTYIAEPPPP